MRDPFAVVAQIGLRFDRERTGHRDRKALVMLVAAGSGGWNAAADLADALGVGPDVQEQWYFEAEEARAQAHRPTRARPARVTPIRARVPA